MTNKNILKLFETITSDETIEAIRVLNDFGNSIAETTGDNVERSVNDDTEFSLGYLIVTSGEKEDEWGDDTQEGFWLKLEKFYNGEKYHFDVYDPYNQHIITKQLDTLNLDKFKNNLIDRLKTFLEQDDGNGSEDDSDDWENYN